MGQTPRLRRNGDLPIDKTLSKRRKKTTNNPYLRKPLWARAKHTPTHTWPNN